MRIHTRLWDTIHIQGIAIDSNKEFIYYSFTTILVKATINGKIIGSVTGLHGHLGCIAYNLQDNCVYGSLEHKNDSIGKMVQENLDADEYIDESFHVAIFNTDLIDRMDMDAFGSGIMETVCLKTVADDYFGKTQGPNGTVMHKYGCSGIDGISFGPDFGSCGGKQYLCVAYGIYGDITREDNDYQVILQYDINDLMQYKSSTGLSNYGIDKPRNKLFLYTGNTEWGIQNLEYDSYTNSWLAAVYKGRKTNFPNYSLFVIDGIAKPVFQTLIGNNEIKGYTLLLSKTGLFDINTGIFGYNFKYGTTGIASLGDGRYYISHQRSTKNKLSYSNIYMYKWTGYTKCPFTIFE